jgi:hypothetical protein
VVILSTRLDPRGIFIRVGQLSGASLSRSVENQPLKCRIRVGGHEIELPVGRTLIGRHDSCQVVLDDPLASRRHAAVHFDGKNATVQDLGSVNGILLNGQRAEGSVPLKDGDQISLGNQTLQVYIGEPGRSRQPHRWGADTLTASSSAALIAQEEAPTLEEPVARPDDEEESTAVRDGEALETRVLLAGKMIRMGRASDAERVVKSALTELLASARVGEVVDPARLELAAATAVQLAEGTSKGEWINYVFSLYAPSGAVLPGSVIDRLYSAVRGVQDVDLGVVRSYLRQLRAKQEQLGPAERFLVRRLDGLEQLAVFR